MPNQGWNRVNRQGLLGIWNACVLYVHAAIMHGKEEAFESNPNCISHNIINYLSRVMQLLTYEPNEANIRSDESNLALGNLLEMPLSPPVTLKRR